MGIADRVYELVKGLPDAEASKILQFAQKLKAENVTIMPANRRVDLALFREYRGRYDGMKIDRESLYDRASVR